MVNGQSSRSLRHRARISDVGIFGRITRRPKLSDRMRIPPTLCAAIVVMAVSAGACSSSSEGATPSTTAAPSTSSTSSSTTTELEVVTTIRAVPAPELASEGHITIGSSRFDFAFECYAAGAGDILALGIGTDSATGTRTQAIVQAFLGQAYVAALIGDTRVLELAIDEPAELFVQSNTIRGSALRFVDASGSAGVGQDMGLGTVTVSCQGFAPGLPDEYIIN